MPKKSKAKIAVDAETRRSIAYDKWLGLMIFAAKRHEVPGRLDVDDLRQEAQITLGNLLLERPDWDPVGEDFSKMFKTHLFHRMVDLVRMCKTQSRDYRKDTSLFRVSPDGEEYSHDLEDSSIDSADDTAIGFDLILKISHILEGQALTVFQMLTSWDSDHDLKSIQRQLGIDTKDFTAIVDTIRSATIMVREDYPTVSLHSVVHMLALSTQMAAVPYYGLRDILDVKSRRLLSMMVSSHLPLQVSLSRLCNMLSTNREDITHRLAQIRAGMKKLYVRGLILDETARSGKVCRAHRGCKHETQLSCWETGIVGCDTHLGKCKYNPSHRFLPAYKEVHEIWCAQHRKYHSNGCYVEGCEGLVVGSCWETGKKGCSEHMKLCSHGEHMTVLDADKIAEHEKWCKDQPREIK